MKKKNKKKRSGIKTIEEAIKVYKIVYFNWFTKNVYIL